MRISDWSSDVCSSDLITCPVVEGTRQAGCDFGVQFVQRQNLFGPEVIAFGTMNALQIVHAELENQRARPVGVAQGKSGVQHKRANHEIGRATCRERECQYV